MKRGTSRRSCRTSSSLSRPATWNSRPMASINALLSPRWPRPPSVSRQTTSRCCTRTKVSWVLGARTAPARRLRRTRSRWTWPSKRATSSSHRVSRRSLVSVVSGGFADVEGTAFRRPGWPVRGDGGLEVQEAHVSRRVAVWAQLGRCACGCAKQQCECTLCDCRLWPASFRPPLQRERRPQGAAFAAAQTCAQYRRL